VIEEEWQAVVNTFTDHYFQNAFKKWQKCQEWWIYLDGATLRVIMASRPKVSF
jgi:hypothetical protein